MRSNEKLCILILVWLVCAGCLCSPGSLLKRALPTAGGTPAQQPLSKPAGVNTSPPAQPENTAVPEPPPVSANGLNSQAPWLVIASETDLWVANPDGSGLQKIVENSLTTRLSGAIQPGGSRLAVITSDADRVHNMALSLLALPDGKVEKITGLTSAETEKYADADFGEPENEAFSAVNQAGLAWSPDGKTLAFVGLMDGPSADVYLYDVASKEIRRVSEDDSQNFNPVWTPDGENLLFFGAESFGTGAGLSMSGVWLARADGSQVKPLYDVKNSSGESLLGWRDKTTAILSSWGIVCGENQLRLLNISNGKTTSIEKECVKAAASPSGTILYGNDRGLYVIDSASKKGVEVAKGESTFVRWSPAGKIFVAGFSDGRLIILDEQGKNKKEAPAGHLLNAAGGEGVWAWTGYNQGDHGVWIGGSGMETVQVFSENADTPIFDAQKNLLFFADTHIYRVVSPAYETADPVAEFPDSAQDVIWLGEG